MRNVGKRGAGALALAAVLLLSGCTYESGEKRFVLEAADSAATELKPAAEAGQLLKAAIEKGETDPDAQKFWYKGHVKNTVLSRTTTIMFEGAVIKPDGYNVDARIARQPYQYYRIGDKRYVRVKDAWMTAKEDPLPFDVLHGFEDLIPLMDRAVLAKESDEIYGVDCAAYQVKMTATEWVAASKSPLFGPLRDQLAGRPDMQQILDNGTVKITLWIGKEDQLIHQYETWIILPFPGGGYMDQQVLFSFYKYNDPGIQIKDPAEVEKYLLY
ncbi:hypothetical protein G3578_04470 [Brevibacillus sp. SYP-B805]|uniref:hypothetical protein n=1 Tax=Brevibacillus sp. SYP-B805 TaxID=1578199 RepID=UPI0013E9B453|nr:hypothetical protein [Brevibacillus sp. SYP-B805]NGQ94431.1 hypothetical protein [Brevibacillus sp. SYP-B805]